MKNNLKISMIVNNDIIWNLMLVYNTCRNLSENFTIDTIYVVPDKISNKAFGKSVPLWYLKTFGVRNFLILSIFSIIRLVHSFFVTGSISFEKTGSLFGISVKYVEDPNSGFLKKDIIETNTNIILLHTTHIIKKDLLKIPDIIFINFFCGDSEQIQGVMPFFWSKIFNIRPCITFHITTSEINRGPIISRYSTGNEDFSMTGFYRYCFEKYPLLIEKVIEKCVNLSGKKTKSDKNYFSYPEKSDYAKFRKEDGKIITIKDLFQEIFNKT